jgi:hypothetical protein
MRSAALRSPQVRELALRTVRIGIIGSAQPRRDGIGHLATLQVHTASLLSRPPKCAAVFSLSSKENRHLRDRSLERPFARNTDADVSNDPRMEVPNEHYNVCSPHDAQFANLTG